MTFGLSGGELGALVMIGFVFVCVSILFLLFRQVDKLPKKR